MGMFDEIRILGHQIRGRRDGPPYTFQTKNFDCLLEWYSIREDGRLYFHKVAESVDPDKASEEARKETDNVTLVDMNYHGIITGIDYYNWYEIKFTDGNLVSITAIED